MKTVCTLFRKAQKQIAGMQQEKRPPLNITIVRPGLKKSEKTVTLKTMYKFSISVHEVQRDENQLKGVCVWDATIFRSMI